MINQDLLNKIRDELDEDLGRWCPEDEDDVTSWCESCLDCPGGNLRELLDQIPEENSDEMWDKIDDIISELSESVIEEMEEE